MKKLLAMVITISIILSFAVIPACASGFSGANILGGGSQVRGEFKGSHGDSNDEYYTRSQSGTGTNRIATRFFGLSEKFPEVLFFCEIGKKSAKIFPDQLMLQKKT